MGWRPYWAVLERGVLSFFRNRADASTGHQRKTFRYLDDATVVVRNVGVAVGRVRFGVALVPLTFLTGPHANISTPNRTQVFRCSPSRTQRTFSPSSSRTGRR